MRISLLFFAITILGAAAPPRPLQEAEAGYFEAYDTSDDAAVLEIPKVAPRDRPVMQWLAAAASQDMPRNPFRKGSKAWTEAESLRRLLASSPGAWAGAIESQSLTMSGSCLAFWRWGRLCARDGRMGKDLRHRWEDKLLASRPPDVLMGYALRHALCFALYEADEDRYSKLKEAWSGYAPDVFVGFQRAFALLSVPSPSFSLWKLPEIVPADLSLSELGTKRVWISADPSVGLPDLPPDTTWIVPTEKGLQPEGSISLVEPDLIQARRLSAKLTAAKRVAYLAPVRKPFETYALMYFPILIELDAAGIIRKIQMGDAALVK